MTLRILFALVIVGWVVKKIWEHRFRKRTGRPAEDLWRTPTRADIRRRTIELEDKITQIERLVGLDDDPVATASILEGLADWEDFVDSGFEREKEQWFRLNRRLSHIAPESPLPIRSWPPSGVVA